MIQFLKFINRLRLGHQPIFVEYSYEFEPRWENGGNPFVRAILERSGPVIASNLAAMEGYLPLIAKLSDINAPEPQINWKNHFIPALDGMSLIWAAKRAKSTFIEVGSGNSTIFVRRSMEHHQSKARLVSIDPFPRVGIDTLCDEIIRKPIEKVDLTVFEKLKADDVVFIDNSHRSFMNSDVTVVMLDILPRLATGVLVGFHDIFLPYDYLKSWASRAYNEQYLVGCYLLSNPDYFDVQLANYWTWSENAHVAPLKSVWDVLGDDVRDRRPSAFWGVKR